MRYPDCGYTLLELLTVVALLGLLASLGFGSVRSFHYRNRVRAPIRQLVVDLQKARVEAMLAGRRVGLVQLPEATYQICRDGDGDGLRRADIRRGIDVCEPAIRGLEVRGLLRLGYLPQRLPNLPPRRGRLERGRALRWGRARGLICNAWGVCSSGRVCWVETRRFRQWCLVVQGHTGRVKVWRYIAGLGWRPIPFP